MSKIHNDTIAFWNGFKLFIILDRVQHESYIKECTTQSYPFAEVNGKIAFFQPTFAHLRN